MSARPSARPIDGHDQPCGRPWPPTKSHLPFPECLCPGVQAASLAGAAAVLPTNRLETFGLWGLRRPTIGVKVVLILPCNVARRWGARTTCPWPVHQHPAGDQLPE
jgi:hypothetical protein